MIYKTREIKISTCIKYTKYGTRSTIWGHGVLIITVFSFNLITQPTEQIFFRGPKLYITIDTIVPQFIYKVLTNLIYTVLLKEEIIIIKILKRPER